MNQVSHSCVPHGVSELAALAQALITFGSVDLPKESRRPEHLTLNTPSTLSMKLTLDTPDALIAPFPPSSAPTRHPSQPSVSLPSRLSTHRQVCHELMPPLSLLQTLSATSVVFSILASSSGRENHALTS